MKNFTKIIAMTALFTLGCSAGSALAEESSSGSSVAAKDWSVTVGMKVWAASWKAHNMIGYRNEVTEENVVLGYGSVTAVYKDYFVSYGQSQSASQEQTSFTNTTRVNNVTTATKYNASRNESDITVGYYITPSLALMIGNKSVTHDFQPAVAGSGTAVKYQWDGLVVGATYFDSFEGSKLVGYGTLTLAPGIKAKITPEPTYGSGKGNYLSAEIGLIYPLSERFRVTGGVRVQSNILTVENMDAFDSVTTGFVVGGSYTF